MKQQIKELSELIDGAKKILITSHISPDPDAISSVLLLGRTLHANFPNKSIKMVLEEKPDRDLDFLKGYDEIDFLNLAQATQEFQPGLFIIVDANTYARISRVDSEKLRSLITSNAVKTIVIDHHEEAGKDRSDIFINNKKPATTEEIYELFFTRLNLKKPTDFAETTLLGIISDTQRHRFDHPGYRETFRIISELLDEGASIEKLESRLEQYNKNELDVFSHLATNIKDSGKGYTYSFISDEFTKNWRATNKPYADLKNGCELFSNQFIRNFENNDWGFIVYPEIMSGPDYYGVSFRSLSGIKDVSVIARSLGGGGHKPAAGAKIEAKNIEEAIQKVQHAITSVYGLLK